ncbi:bifunctional folylpolyglutamate synthase/dihydrofolate synthase [Streptomyces sp. NRRL S-350]|uniref:bifunctional folylpolyglutamate synthase/dihydrofolate synthase n=1 Tax=Streptomyces sp. NRRL S-350 TaxID=1463902 RepID=UPI0004BE916D|nr:Mur ligase family protein [Streptomyces sp. NRRL S-350]
MDYQQCTDHLCELYRLPRTERDARRENLPALLAAIGRPQDGLRGAMVVGTNGKGSTAAFAVAALSASGQRVGSMPSPHLQEARERVRVAGRPVSRAEFAAAFTEVTAAIEEHHLPLSAAGMCTAVAAAHFRRAGVTHVVAEASIGGRRAAVRALDLDVKVITGVGLDHTDLLGGTLAQVAKAKAGAVRDGDHVVLGRLHPQAQTAVEEVLADRTGLTLWQLDRHIHCTARPDGAAGATVLDVATPRGEHRALPCPLPGPHQHHNLALGLATAAALAERGHARTPTDDLLRPALAATRWPGRLELLTDARLDGWHGRVLLDGAHNPQGMATVLPEIERIAGATRSPRTPPTAVVFAARHGKDVPAMLAVLPEPWPLVLTRTGSPDAGDPATLHTRLPPARRAGTVTAPDTATALRRAAGLVGPGGLVVVLGSLRLVGECRTALGLPPA